jgi:hypothetical protein
MALAVLDWRIRRRGLDRWANEADTAHAYDKLYYQKHR